MGLSSHQSSRMKSGEWITPKWITDPLGHFDLDPCAPKNPPWKIADKHYWKGGLDMPWFGRVWLNPPFGKEAEQWLANMLMGTALVAARTETKWFFNQIWSRATGVLFVKSRPHFHYADGRRADFNSGAPICLVAYGRSDANILRCSGLGKFVWL